MDEAIKLEHAVPDTAIASSKRTHIETEQPVAKRRITDWPSEVTETQQQQEEEFEHMNQSMSQVGIGQEDQDMSSPVSPIVASLAVNNVPFIPEQTATPDLVQEEFDQDEKTPEITEYSLDSSSSAAVPQQSCSSTTEDDTSKEVPKVRKITDFFSVGQFDPNRFFTPSVKKDPIIKHEPETDASVPRPSPQKKKRASTAPTKKKAPAASSSSAQKRAKATTSKRLIKPDPEEMSDDLTSETEACNPVQETPSQFKTKKDRAIVIEDDEEERFMRFSPPAAPETSLSLSQIKTLLERIKDGLEPDIFDPRYYCRACSKPFDRQKTFFNHIHSKHGVNIEERKFVVLNYGPKPNITDESMFCTYCQKQYQSKDRFQHHNELHHGAEKVKLNKAALVLKRGVVVAEADLQPDEIEEQETMDTMEQTEKKDKEATKNDLENHRRLGYCQEAILKHTGPPPDVNDPNFHCNVCMITYRNRGSYHNHLRSVHKMDFPFGISCEKVRKAYKGPLPDIHHPENYCCVCDIYYSKKLVYTYHLRNVHNMDIPFEKSPGVRIAIDDIKDESRKPDRFDPDYFCAYCNRGYTQRASYQIHLNKMHFIDIPQKRPNAMKPRPPLEPGVTPDVLDPNHYCHVCDVKFAHANSYRIHIKKYHGLGDALEAITLSKRSKGIRYYHDRRVTNAGYHEERAKSTQQKLDFKPSTA